MDTSGSVGTTVAYLGPAGTFTEAALSAFERDGALGVVANRIPCASPGEAVEAVRAGSADRAVIAMENSVDGPVTQAFDALGAGGVQIFREHDLAIAFTIMTRPGQGEICTLATHPVAYQQIRGWLGEHLPGVRFLPAPSNADAARLVAEGGADAAAAPARAAELFGLESVATGVADRADARTRFALVGRRSRPTPHTGSDRTSIVFTLPHEPGTLADALQEFSRRGVQMLRIESRPTRREFGTYQFFVDVAGHLDDAAVGDALRALWLRAESLSYLGSWPVAAGTAPATPTDSARLAEADRWVADLRKGIRP